MVNAMEWLYSQEEYNTIEKRREVKDIRAGVESLEGHLDLREFVNLTKLVCSRNNLTSIDFLNQLPNPEKLVCLRIFGNKIQPTDISIFSKFVNLKELKIGAMAEDLQDGRHNKFYGSFKSWKNLTKLNNICIEATDVNEGLEYLPESLAKATKGGDYNCIECSPQDTNAKCFAIQDQLRPFDYDLEAWRIVNFDKVIKVRDNGLEEKQKLISELETKINETQQELQQTKNQEADKTKKIERLETKLKLLEATKTNLEKELEKEQQQHNQTKTNYQSQLRDLATILFPSNHNLNSISFSDLKSQAEKFKKACSQAQTKNQELTKLQTEKQTAIQALETKLNQSQTQVINLQEALVEEEKHRDRNHEMAKQKDEIVKQKSEELKRTQEKIKTLEESKKELTLHQQTNQQNLTNLTQQIQTQTKEVQALKLQLTQSEQTQTELNHTQEQIKQLQSKITLLEQQKATYQTKYDKSIEFIKEIREEVKNL